MEFTAEQMKAVAEKVYPGRHAVGHEANGKTWVYLKPLKGEDAELFAPSLTGTERERAQALDCIVAAEKICAEQKYCFACCNDEPDILTAAICALLEHTGERG